MSNTTVYHHAVSQIDTWITNGFSSFPTVLPGRVAQSVGHLTSEKDALVSIPGLATYFRFSFR